MTKETLRQISEAIRVDKDRVRNVIGEAHWHSDGVWKEYILRKTLANYLQAPISIGSGFIKTNRGLSNQIDILIYDGNGPTIFRFDEFVIVPPDVVRAVIQVKTSGKNLKKSVEQLNKAAQVMEGQARRDGNQIFFGLFIYDYKNESSKRILSIIQNINGSLNWNQIDALSIGDSKFIRFHRQDPTPGVNRRYDKWHAYDLQGMAPGYFIHNVVEKLFPDAVGNAPNDWYLPEGKEPYRHAIMARNGEFSQT